MKKKYTFKDYVKALILLALIIIIIGAGLGASMGFIFKLILNF